jgi:hypothetical protein
MTFVTIPPTSYQVGDPITVDIISTMISNDNDLDSRTTNLEISTPKINFIKFLLLNGSVFPTATGLYYYEADEAFTITEANIRIFEKGSLTGAVEIDIKRSTTDMDNASFTTIFTTKPKITYASASDYDKSTNQVFNGSQINIAVGDILRLDITETPGNGVLPKLLITAYGE